MASSHRHFYSHLLLVLLTFLVACHVHRGAAETDAGDAAAMRALAKALGADRALGWTGPVDPCTWTGVTCTDARVTAIQIGNRSLVGTLPAEVRNLTALLRLELQENQLSGSLPSLAGLSSLQALLLHGNRFSGAPPPDFFAGLSSLQSVYLDDNPFDPWSIPASLKDATALVNFSANCANVSGELPNFLATAFASLDHLALAFNLLSGAVPAAFAAAPLRSLWLNNQLGSSRLSGGIAFVANMTSLEELWLQSNDFTGPLPDFSGLQHLADLQLRDNRLTGPLPASLTTLKSLKRVTLTNNLLQGPVPVFPDSVKTLDLNLESERFCLTKTGDCDPTVGVLLSIAKSFGYPNKLAENWRGNDPCSGRWLAISCDSAGNITVMNFRKMGLNGTISPDFGSITSLQKLLLSKNNLTGTIPSTLSKLPSLKELDVSNNVLWGQVPTFSMDVLVNTAGNPSIGKDAGTAPAPGAASTAGGNSNSADLRQSSSGGKSSSSVPLGVIVGSMVAAVLGINIVGLLGFCYYKKKKQAFGRVQSPNTMAMQPQHAGSIPDVVKTTVAGSSSNGRAAIAYSRTSSCPSDVHVVEAGSMVISVQVLRNVTNNFGKENILGEGGFGVVYKGELYDGTKIAVKRMEAGVMGTKGLNEFKSEIAVLSKVRHRHLVSLLGYCLEGGERLLVYEYMPRGTLSRHLFEWKEEGLKPLEWKKRLSIALDVARGVEYLHNLAHQSFIHRDLKPSNILLGDDMKAKVADFGLVRLADGKGVSVETKLAGTFGYLAPEYAGNPQFHGLSIFICLVCSCTGLQKERVSNLDFGFDFLQCILK